MTLPTYFAIGYWYADDEPYPCKPQMLVDSTWDGQERQAVIAHIRQAKEMVFYRGFSSCRFCDAPNGSSDKSDGLFFFPEGFDHYIEHHQVKPPQLFIDFALGRDVRSHFQARAEAAHLPYRNPFHYPVDESYHLDFSWWIEMNNPELLNPKTPSI